MGWDLKQHLPPHLGWWLGAGGGGLNIIGMYETPKFKNYREVPINSRKILSLMLHSFLELKTC